jgi:hypothetical protein
MYTQVARGGALAGLRKELLMPSPYASRVLGSTVQVRRSRTASMAGCSWLPGTGSPWQFLTALALAKTASLWQAGGLQVAHCVARSCVELLAKPKISRGCA